MKVEHPNAATIIAGDKNDLDEGRILAIDPALVQIVRSATRKDKILSVVITDLRRFYIEPRIIDPVPVDNVNHGVPSDHNGVLVVPLSNQEDSRGTKKEIKFVRPMPESSILEYRRSLGSIDWSLMINGLSSSDMVQTFQEMTNGLMDIHFPLKRISISPYDKPYFTEELKKLRRYRQRIYRKHGRSPKYLEVKEEFDDKLKAEAKKYKDKIVAEVSDGKRGSSYAAIKKLGSREFEVLNKAATFDIPEFVENGYDDNQSTEALADFFSSISQEFEPIDVSRFTLNIREKLEEGNNDVNFPILNEHEVYKKISKAKIPHSTVPGDIKRALVKDCNVELTEPVTRIYNEITRSKEFPRPWVNEQQTPIPKKHPPESLDDLRNISGTPFFSKQYESFLSDWLLPIVEPFLDPGQCGGLKKSSISHYLIKLLHFIHYNLDKPQPHAVILACVDMSKAFNRMSHQQVIEDLFNMKVPGWLLLILISYLTERKMILKFRNILSTLRSLPGSSPQGTVLGVILFIILFNGAALRPAIPRPSWPLLPRMNNNPAAIKLKFVDDLSIAAQVNLNKDLANVVRQKPLAFAERFETDVSHEANIIQRIADGLSQFSEERQMRINSKKSKVMKFSVSRVKDFPAEVVIDGNILEVKDKLKILGVIVTPNLKWDANTEFICKKAYSKMWAIRRMKALGLDNFTLLDFYLKEVRVHLELAVPVWHSGLTGKLSADIERVQRVAITVILGQYDIHYIQACTHLGLKPLFIRRQELCERFALKTSSPDCRHSDMFQLEKNGTHFTRGKNRFREHVCLKNRFYKSPLPYLTRLLNQL